jgi:hypothetical protein
MTSSNVVPEEFAFSIHLGQGKPIESQWAGWQSLRGPT